MPSNYQRNLTNTSLYRFIQKIRPSSKDGDCWIWMGSKLNGRGVTYGSFRHEGRSNTAHRFSYLTFKGSIPDNMTIDHACNNGLCVNSVHLQLMSMRENILKGSGWAGRNHRKTICPAGHPYSIENTYFYTLERNGKRGRSCRACSKERMRRKAKEDYNDQPKA